LSSLLSPELQYLQIYVFKIEVVSVKACLLVICIMYLLGTQIKGQQNDISSVQEKFQQGQAVRDWRSWTSTGDNLWGTIRGWTVEGKMWPTYLWPLSGVHPI
jgi:hypothetical protein